MFLLISIREVNLKCIEKKNQLCYHFLLERALKHNFVCAFDIVLNTGIRLLPLSRRAEGSIKPSFYNNIICIVYFNI